MAKLISQALEVTKLVRELSRGPMVQLTRGELDHCLVQATMKDAWSRGKGIRDFVGDRGLGSMTPSQIGIMGELAVSKYFNFYPDLEWGMKKDHKHFDLLGIRGDRIEVKTTTQLKKREIIIKSKWKPGEGKYSVELFSDEYVWVKMEHMRPVHNELDIVQKYEYLVPPNFYLVGRMDQETYRENRVINGMGKCKYTGKEYVDTWKVDQSVLKNIFPQSIYGKAWNTK